MKGYFLSGFGISPLRWLGALGYQSYGVLGLGLRLKLNSKQCRGLNSYLYHFGEAPYYDSSIIYPKSFSRCLNE